MEGSLWLELVRASLPEVPLDKGVAQANTGSLLLDSLPLLTMAPAAKASVGSSSRGSTPDARAAAAAALVPLQPLHLPAVAHRTHCLDHLRRLWDCTGGGDATWTFTCFSQASCLQSCTMCCTCTQR